MSHRLSFLSTLSFSLLSIAALAGCPGESGAHFADASDAQLERALAASSGSDLGQAAFIGIVFSGMNDPTTCPRLATTGQDTVASGGCTTEEGDRWEGEIRIHNFPGFFQENPAYDPTQPSVAEFEVTVTPSDGEVVSIDGQVRLEEAVLSGDLALDFEGITSVSRLALGCEDDGPCTASPDSEIEISDLGTGSVEGTWTMDDPPSGSVTVRGADSLVFDIASRDANGCVPFTVGDRSGTICDPNVQGEEGAALAGSRPRPIWSRPLIKAQK
jgi:hypothetical protein